MVNVILQFFISYRISLENCHYALSLTIHNDVVISVVISERCFHKGRKIQDIGIYNYNRSGIRTSSAPRLDGKNHTKVWYYPRWNQGGKFTRPNFYRWINNIDDASNNVTILVPKFWTRLYIQTCSPSMIKYTSLIHRYITFCCQYFHSTEYKRIIYWGE